MSDGIVRIRRPTLWDLGNLGVAGVALLLCIQKLGG